MDAVRGVTIAGGIRADRAGHSASAPQVDVLMRANRNALRPATTPPCPLLTRLLNGAAHAENIIAT